MHSDSDSGSGCESLVSVKTSALPFRWIAGKELVSDSMQARASSLLHTGAGNYPHAA